MCSESVCQVARSWVEVGSFYKRLFAVVYVTCGDFHDGSENGPSHTSVLTQQFLAIYKIAVIPTHLTPLIWHPVTSSYFQK
jgi:hypothetical protein